MHSKEQNRIYQAAWRASHPERDRANYTAWRAANPEKVRAAKAKYRAAHAEKVRAYMAAYREAHREQARVTQAKYREEHPEETRLAMLAWRDARARGEGEGMATMPEANITLNIDCPRCAGVKECSKCGCNMYHNAKAGWYCPECKLALLKEVAKAADVYLFGNKHICPDDCSSYNALSTALRSLKEGR